MSDRSSLSERARSSGLRLLPDGKETEARGCMHQRDPEDCIACLYTERYGQEGVRDDLAEMLADLLERHRKMIYGALNMEGSRDAYVRLLEMLVEIHGRAGMIAFGELAQRWADVIEQSDTIGEVRAALAEDLAQAADWSERFRQSRSGS